MCCTCSFIDETVKSGDKCTWKYHAAPFHAFFDQQLHKLSTILSNLKTRFTFYYFANLLNDLGVNVKYIGVIWNTFGSNFLEDSLYSLKCSILKPKIMNRMHTDEGRGCCLVGSSLEQSFSSWCLMKWLYWFIWNTSAQIRRAGIITIRRRRSSSVLQHSLLHFKAHRSVIYSTSACPSASTTNACLF